MLVLQESERSLEELVNTCKLLTDAPDEYAKVRLSADILLSQVDPTMGISSAASSEIAIARIADRYRGTSAEAESLMFCVSTALDLGNVALISVFRRALSERFAHTVYD